MPHFDTLKLYSCGIHHEKRRNCLLQAISPFLTMFSTVYDAYFAFQMQFEMSAICLKLGQSKILSSGNGLSYDRSRLLFCRTATQFLWSFQINLRKILKAQVALRGFIIEWVNVRGFNEDNPDDSKVNIFLLVRISNFRLVHIEGQSERQFNCNWVKNLNYY